MFSFSLVANSFSLSYLDEVLINTVKVFNSKVLTNAVHVSRNWLQKEMNLLNSTSMGLPSENAELTTYNSDHSESEAKSVHDDVSDQDGGTVSDDKNPFEAHFRALFDRIKNEHGGPANNPLYYPEAIQVLKKKWLPTVSFWTSLLLGECMNIIKVIIIIS